jgi:Flp pilus assembly CpaF family ATPase
MNYNEFINKINQYFQINNVTNDTKEKDMLIKNLQSENDALKQINSTLKSFIKDNS